MKQNYKYITDLLIDYGHISLLGLILLQNNVCSANPNKI